MAYVQQHSLPIDCHILVLAVAIVGKLLVHLPLILCGLVQHQQPVEGRIVQVEEIGVGLHIVNGMGLDEGLYVLEHGVGTCTAAGTCTSAGFPRHLQQRVRAVLPELGLLGQRQVYALLSQELDRLFEVRSVHVVERFGLPNEPSGFTAGDACPQRFALSGFAQGLQDSPSLVWLPTQSLIVNLDSKIDQS